eukprot:GILJ01007494.1.p1 GENE.GILJ01007494.1~~GILJ01007494.1.p1  ORF type:complete len:392 (+),score=82.31 GILJ01007494.1:37-1212(+)
MKGNAMPGELMQKKKIKKILIKKAPEVGAARHLAIKNVIRKRKLTAIADFAFIEERKRIASEQEKARLAIVDEGKPEDLLSQKETKEKLLEEEKKKAHDIDEKIVLLKSELQTLKENKHKLFSKVRKVLAEEEEKRKKAKAEEEKRKAEEEMKKEQEMRAQNDRLYNESLGGSVQRMGENQAWSHMQGVSNGTEPLRRPSMDGSIPHKPPALMQNPLQAFMNSTSAPMMQQQNMQNQVHFQFLKQQAQHVASQITAGNVPARGPPPPVPAMSQRPPAPMPMNPYYSLPPQMMQNPPSRPPLQQHPSSSNGSGYMHPMYGSHGRGILGNAPPHPGNLDKRDMRPPSMHPHNQHNPPLQAQSGSLPGTGRPPGPGGRGNAPPPGMHGRGRGFW